MTGGAASEIRFWFDFASTYSWLSALRVEALAAPAGVRVIWQPFLLGPIFKAKGWKTSPFNLDPAKGRHMWRDIERRAARLGHRVLRPDPFPQNSLRAARVMTAAAQQPWAPEFAARLMTAEFTAAANISDDAVIGAAIGARGADAAPWLARADTDATKAALRAATAHAAGLGIFGAPSFTVAGELFWGDDRLEEALDWAAARHPAQPRPR